MTDYHVYFLDPGNHIRRRMDMECEDDDQAIQVVREHLSHNAMELWSRDRLVKRFEAGTHADGTGDQASSSAGGSS